MDADPLVTALPTAAAPAERAVHHAEVSRRLALLLDGEDDWIAALATVTSELHQAFEYFDWTGFYRAARPDTLIIGPYQGGHGCLRIPFGRGVCGTAARDRRTVVVPDVGAFPGHIACSSTTRSEIVVPVLGLAGDVLGVLDVDSNQPDAFRPEDVAGLEAICADLARRFPRVEQR